MAIERVGLGRRVRVHVVADLLNVFANPKKSRKLQDQEGQRG
eukprot:CAMPEP_0181481336 /NCGR_PEP_ID=MMETSP1110-20121109/44263_1 /TAXON_ID=174948 /ORGANISM="Symbiodinium sp., Strain CCMP421" /LENGTH=41 /DNA_ID= /DNA_START= /DNA_END= /DNA_ORIENTATION=